MFFSGDCMFLIIHHSDDGGQGVAYQILSSQTERDTSPHIVHIYLLYCSQTKITEQGTCFKENQMNVASKIKQNKNKKK